MAITEYSYAAHYSEYSLMDRDVSIGDATFVYLRRTKQSDGEYRVYYALQSSYKNYVSIVGGYGWDDELDLDYVIRVAEISMEKIKSAPLGNWVGE